MALSIAQDTQCTERFMELSLLTYRAGQIPDGERQGTRLDDEIRLLPDITFTCPTVITSLALGINVRRDRDHEQFPSILLVKPTYNESDVIGYTLLTEQTIYYTSDNFSTNGVYNYPLDPPISVNVSDILGIRAPRLGDTAVRIYYVSLPELGYITTVLDSNNLDQVGSENNDLVLVYPIAGNTI